MRLMTTVLASALVAPSVATAPPSRLPIIEDDYDRAAPRRRGASFPCESTSGPPGDTRVA
jgi:hypothetical protein